MKITNIKINQFRSLMNFQLDFQENNLVLIGKNGVGKTTVIEAIYYCALFSSFRAKKRLEMIGFNHDIAQLAIEYQSLQKENKLIIGFSKTKQKLVYNNQQNIKKIDIIGSLKVILLNPETINLIDLSPAVRRNYIDVYLSQLNREYLLILQKFSEYLKIKKALLKSDPQQIDNDYLSLVNQQVIESNDKLVLMRKEFLEKIQKEATDIYQKISGANVELIIEYSQTQVVSLKAELFKKKTLFGINLDDFTVLLDGINIKTYGSQGQRRTVAIALILSQLTLNYSHTNEKPIILVDDVHLELDESRQKNLFEFLNNQSQIIYATTELSKIPKIISDNAQVVKL